LFFRNTHRVLFYVVLLTSFVFPLILGILFRYFNEINQYWYYLFSKLILIVFIIYYIKKQGISFKKINVRLSSPKYILIAIFLGCMMQPIIIFLNKLQQYFVTKEWYSSSELLSFITERYENLSIPYIIMYGILIVIGEELLFRGILLEKYSLYNDINKTIFIGSIMFSIAHMSIYLLFYSFIMGVILTLLTISSRSIFPALILHFIVNEIFKIYLHFPANLYVTILNIMMKPTITILSIVVVIALIIFIYKKIDLPNNETKPNIRFFDRYSISILILFGIMAIIQFCSLVLHYIKTA
jgi:uncharacterized protein